MTKKLLFLCTGNYYRSRFAEIIFNDLVARQNLNWHAASRGLAVELGSGNVGPISQQVITALKKKGIDLRNPRYPTQLLPSDLEQADKIIALYDREHRPLIQQKFLPWLDRIDYWSVPDLDITTADQALPLIEHNLQTLIRELTEKQNSSA